MVILCGLHYDRVIEKQSQQLPVTSMNKTGEHPAASGAVQN
jgi:hypothetical protein